MILLSSWEFLKETLHNVETKAATRAINKAISDLVAEGEVFGEEITIKNVEGNKQNENEKKTSKTGKTY